MPGADVGYSIMRLSRVWADGFFPALLKFGVFVGGVLRRLTRCGFCFLHSFAVGGLQQRNNVWMSIVLSKFDVKGRLRCAANGGIGYRNGI